MDDGLPGNIVEIPLPNDRTLIQVKFWRIAPTPGQVESKRRKLIADIREWIKQQK